MFVLPRKGSQRCDLGFADAGSLVYWGWCSQADNYLIRVEIDGGGGWCRAPPSDEARIGATLDEVEVTAEPEAKTESVDGLPALNSVCRLLLLYSYFRCTAAAAAAADCLSNR